MEKEARRLLTATQYADKILFGSCSAKSTSTPERAGCRQ
jgi:hypothetical protein